MMNIIFKNKEDIGKILFGVSIILLIVMILLPNTTLITNMDEHFSYGLIKLTGAEFWNTLMNDTSPPLYFLILQAVYFLIINFNIPIEPVYALKLVSVMSYLGILLVSGTTLRKRYDWFTVGLFTFSIITMSRFFTQFLLMRMYGIATLFFFLIYIVYMRLLENFDNKSWILLTILTILSAYTHNILLITLALIYLFILLYILRNNDPNINKKTQLIKWTVSAIVSVGTYVPWLISLIHQMSIRSSTAGKQSVLDYINYLTYHMTGLNNATVDLFVVKLISVLFLLIIIVLAYNRYRNNQTVENYEISSGIFIYVLTLIIGGVMVLLTFRGFEARYVMPTLVIFWLATSILIGKLDNKKLFCILTIAILLVGTYGIIQTLSAQDIAYSQASRDMQCIEMINDSNVVIYSIPLQYQFYHQYLTNTKEYIIKEDPNRPLPSDVIVESDLAKIIKDNRGKDVYMFAGKKSKIDTDHVHGEKISSMGQRTLYKLTLK